MSSSYLNNNYGNYQLGGMPLNGNKPNNQSYNQYPHRDDSNSFMSNKMMGVLGGTTLLAPFLSSLFGGDDYQNPANAANSYLDKIPGYTDAYNPYIDAGQRALKSNEHEYNGLVNDPGGRLNQIGQGYHQSPGFQFALQQALGNVGNSANARGLTGSGQADYERMQTATGLADQDYNGWMSHALGLYQNGLTGMGHNQDMGYNALDEKTKDLMNSQMTKAQLAYSGQNNANQQSDPFSTLMSGVSSALPFFAGL